MIGTFEREEDPFKREQQFKEIGVSEQILIDALAAGDSAAARCTANHPKMAPGMYRFLETVASLGDQLSGLGWTREDYKGFATVVRPDRLVAIAVASGDDGTGNLWSEVTTRSPKGVTTAEAVEQNLSLPLDERYIADNEKIVAHPDQADVAAAVTYFLLHDRRGGIRYAELSRPTSINTKGYVETWEPRIPLKPQSIDPIKIDVGGEPPINPIVDVKRRDSA